jgi:hypothetical protein
VKKNPIISKYLDYNDIKSTWDKIERTNVQTEYAQGKNELRQKYDVLYDTYRFLIWRIIENKGGKPEKVSASEILESLSGPIAGISTKLEKIFKNVILNIQNKGESRINQVWDNLKSEVYDKSEKFLKDPELFIGPLRSVIWVYIRDPVTYIYKIPEIITQELEIIQKAEKDAKNMPSASGITPITPPLHRLHRPKILRMMQSKRHANKRRII